MKPFFFLTLFFLPFCATSAQTPELIKKLGPPSPVDSEFVALASGITQPKAGATAAEQFLHQLARITGRYLLDTAYMPSSNSAFNDLAWAEWRARSLVSLLKSPVGKNAPEELLEFCRKALEVEALFQKSWELEFPQRYAKDPDAVLRQITSTMLVAMIADLEADAGRAAQPWSYWNTPINQNTQSATARIAEDIILPAMRRHEQAIDYLEEAMALKKRLGLHDGWVRLLNNLAAQDASLRPYAADPRVTDPCWHFGLVRSFGEVFFGECITTRGKDEPSSPIRQAAPIVSFGDLGEGPVMVHISSREGGWAFQFGFDEETAPERAYVLNCTKGHIGAKIGIFRGIWAAQGMKDWGSDGMCKFSSNSLMPHLVSHMPVTGAEVENEVEGTLLIYLTSQFPSDEEAAKKARHIKLFDLPHETRRR